MPRLHQVKPTRSDSAIATSTPVTTAATRRVALRSVWYSVTCTTSRAVSGASTGRAVPPGRARATR